MGHEAGERGSISVTVIVVFFALLFMLVIGTNWVDNDLALGAFRTAVSQAAQAGSLEGAPGGPVAACLAAAAQARGNLVSGPLGRDVRITCTVEGTGPQVIVVTADGTLPNWVVPITAHVHVVAQANIEVDPTQPS